MTRSRKQQADQPSGVVNPEVQDQKKHASRGIKNGPRTHPYVIRMSDKERVKIAEQADRLCLEKAAYIRARIFGYQLPSPRGAIDDQKYCELSRLVIDLRNAGGNISQLSNKVDLGCSSEVQEALLGISEFRPALDRVRLHLVSLAEDFEPIPGTPKTTSKKQQDGQPSGKVSPEDQDQKKHASRAIKKDARIHPFVIRMSDDELVQITEQAGRLCSEKATYVRARIFGYQLPSPRGAIDDQKYCELQRLVTDMKNAGGTINQLAHKVNSGFPVEAQEALQGISEFRQGLNHVRLHLVSIADDFEKPTSGKPKETSKMRQAK